MLQFQKTQVDPDIHRAILSTLDPRYFSTEGRPGLDYYIEKSGASRVQDFLVAFSKIFQDRITSCMEHLRNIANMMEYNLVPDPALIQLFIGAGGSWEEVALMAASNPGQEALLRQAIAEEGADPFIVDPNSGLALLDLPGLSEECREVVLMAQRKALANNERLAQLVLLLRDKDTILLVMESFRQLTVEAHRKVFDHSC